MRGLRHFKFGGIAGWVYCVLWIPVASALDPAKSMTQYDLDVWTERDGLPQGSVQALVQTRDGYLWIGTRDGLARFDGTRFAVFRAETDSGLSSNDIRVLWEDPARRLWIGTFNEGICWYVNGRFERAKFSDRLPSGGVIEIYGDRAGNVWLGTWNGLARFHAGRIQIYGAADGLIGRHVCSVREDASGTLWVATETALHRQVDNRFERIEGPGAPLSPIREIRPTADGSIWIATTGGGLARWRPGGFDALTVRDGLSDNKVRTLLEDRQQNLLVGTWRGLCRLRENRVSRFTRSEGLPHDYIEALCEDREGNLWVGTRGGGLARLRDGKFATFTTSEGLPHDFAKCVLEDRSGQIWIGTHGGGLSCRRGESFTNYGIAEGLASPFIWSLCEDLQGLLWVGTARPAGLCVLRNGRFESIASGAGFPIQDGVRALFADAAGNIWCGGDGGGLARWRDGVFTVFTPRHGLISDRIRVIGEDRTGSLWIGTVDGLSRYRDGRFTSFTRHEGLAHDTVYALHEDSAGTLWLGTQGGLSRRAGDRFHSYTVRDGLFHNVIYRILEDAEGRLWMSGNRGVFSLARREIEALDRGSQAALNCTAYGAADGMKAAQCEGASQPSGWKDRTGRLWFPTANGVARIDPSSARRSARPPPVIIERFLAGGRGVGMAPGVAAVLESGAREVQFHYTALSLGTPENVRFRYQLEGAQPDWTDAETRRVAQFSRLRPGHYLFRVTASNNDGAWHETGASLAFVVPPYVYETGWFYAGAGALACLLAWVFHRRRMHLAQAEFSLILKERSRIARDLHDTLAQGFAGIGFQLEAVAEKLAATPGEARHHLDLALRMVRHSLGEARRSVMNLRTPVLDRGNLGAALEETARQLVEGCPVVVQVRTIGIARPLPPGIEENVPRIGQEALTNALRHGGARRVEVQLEYAAARVCLIVRDDGRGFDPRELEQPNGQHFGWLGMRERAKQVNGRLRIRSAPGSGTEVALEFPVNTRLARPLCP